MVSSISSKHVFYLHTTERPIIYPTCKHLFFMVGSPTRAHLVFLVKNQSRRVFQPERNRKILTDFNLGALCVLIEFSPNYWGIYW